MTIVCHAQETSKIDTTAVRTEGVIHLTADANRYAIYPGCEDKKTIDTQKKCFDKKFRNFIHQNFDKSLPKKLKLSGKFRMIVAFTIDEEGRIQNIRSRASHPQFNTELKRILESFPKVKPALTNGEPTTVMPTIPLIFTWD
jgi:hypothetical protein